MKHFAQLKRESPFFPIFTDGKAPILPLLQAAKVQLEGSDETDVYFLDWSRCTHTQRTQIADQLSKAFAATSGINPPRFLAWMNSGEGKLPIRVSQTESATIGADMRSFL